MYRRDFGILFLALFAIFWALQNEGAYQYHAAFYHKYASSTDDLDSHDSITPPVVADLNGDGQLELILITQDLELQVLSPKAAAMDGNGFAKATVKGSKEVMLGRVRLGGRKPIALSVGYIDPPRVDVVHLPRKMVLVVVTSGWVVMCFDHNLKLMWDKSIQAKFPHHASVREVAVHISNHTVKAGDRGMIVVGGSVSLGDLSEETIDAAVDEDKDAFNEELRLEEDELYRARNRKAGTAGNIDIDEHGVDLSRNFQWHAYEASKGSERWHNTGSDFHKDLELLSDVLTPQHNYKLDAQSLQGRAFGQATCREYWDSILHVLPHSWEKRSDTHIRTTRFVKSKAGRGANKKALGTGNLSGRKDAPEAGLKHHAGINEHAKLSHTIGRVASMAGGSGTSVETQLHPKTRHRKQHPPNALVVHLEEGISAVHLYSGHPICTLSLPPHQLHTDLNGDGVLDHVVAIGSDTHIRQATQRQHETFHNCWVYVSSGIPARNKLFNGTLCRSSHIFENLHRSADGSAPSTHVEMAKPITIPVPNARGHYRPVKGQHHYAVFLNSRGDLTAYSPIGIKQWQAHTHATWVNHRSDQPGDRVVPTLHPLPLHTHATPAHVLVAGTHTAAIYSLNGDRIDQFELPAAPTMQLIVLDFTGDGLNDLLLVTKTHIYGFQLVKHLGAGLPYAAMLGCLLIATVAVYVTQQGPAAGAKKRFRSTERVD